MKLLFSLLILISAAVCAAAQAADPPRYKEESEVPRVTVEEAKKAFDEKKVVLVDSRAAEYYKQEHIKGAINIPIGSEDFTSVPKGKRIIVYCT